MYWAIWKAIIAVILSYQASIATPTPLPTEVPPTRVPPTATPRPVVTPVAAPKPSPVTQPPSEASQSILAAIRYCESHGRYHIVHSSGIHYGAYGFDEPTWRSVGGSGLPHHASPAEQDYRASLLLQSRGTQPWPWWPNCPHS